MKMPISWHQNNLRCWKSSQEKLLSRIQKLEHEAAENIKYIMHYSMQIDSAIKEGKDGFDIDKYKKATK